MDSLAKVRQLIRDTELQVRSAAPPAPVRPVPVHVEVDGITANYRAQFGPPPAAQYTHPEQYDPVLRFHLNMPPAPDPHEESRRFFAAIRAQRRPDGDD